MTEIDHKSPSVYCDDSTPTDRRNMRGLLAILMAWAVSFLGATYAIKHELLPAGAFSWMAAAVPTLLGLGVIFTYRRYLREADELQRVIQTEALALGFGVGWLVICGYPLFERLGAPAADISDYLVAMVIAYSIGSVVGRRRYR